MAENFTQYRARVLGYLGERDPMRVLSRTPARLERELAGVRRTRLTRRPGRGKWSILEIVSHMVDAELAFGWRLRNMLATPGTPLSWFDQDVWAARLGYNQRKLRPMLEQFRSLRESNLMLLRSTSRQRWHRCFGIHEVRGRQTVAEFVTLEAAHDLNHLRQITALLG
jgi:uncharacterized damage-inducible protein DinB